MKSWSCYILVAFRNTTTARPLIQRLMYRISLFGNPNIAIKDANCSVTSLVGLLACLRSNNTQHAVGVSKVSSWPYRVPYRRATRT